MHLWLSGIGHMVKDHSGNERRNLLPLLHGLFPISSKEAFIYTISADRIVHTMAFGFTSCYALAGTGRKEMFYLPMH